MMVMDLSRLLMANTSRCLADVVPKPVQKPHPPIWVACSKRETIHQAARHGIGALTFAFIDQSEAIKWVQEYYDIIKSDDCIPIGHTVNANVAMVSGFSCHADPEEARRRGLDGFRFFGYALGHHYIFGEHVPGHSIWAQLRTSARPPARTPGARHRSPEQIAEHMRRLRKLGSIKSSSAAGRQERAGHICASLELFAASVMPLSSAARRPRRKKRAASRLHRAGAHPQARTVGPCRQRLPSSLPLGKQQAIQESADGKTANFGRGDLQVPLEDPLKNKG